MRPYIDFNNQKRKEATNEADKIYLSYQIMLYMVKLWKIWEKEPK